MSRPSLGIRCAFVALASLWPAAPAQAQILLLHTFTGGVNDGNTPAGSLLLSGPNLYGVTFGGGSGGDGTIFQLGINGAGFNLYHSFLSGANDGRNPLGSLIQSGSNLYGMTEAGGAGEGTVFQLGTNGTGFGLVHRFAGPPGDGSGPQGSLVQSGSTLYGITQLGGSANLGSVFKVSTDGTGETVLHSFAGTPGDGQHPLYATLVVSGSTLYGMCLGGGSAGTGTIFKINMDGTGYAVLHSFTGGAGDGLTPYGSLTLSGSTLYGTTSQGGSANKGTIFKIDTDGTGFGLVHSFAGGPADGANPEGELLISGSTMYGMTPLGGADALGTLFGVGTDGSNFNLLHSFIGGISDGASPQGDVVISGSTLYGMTVAGGSSNDGVIFSIAVPEPSSLLLLAGGASIALLVRCRQARRVKDTGS